MARIPARSIVQGGDQDGHQHHPGPVDAGLDAIHPVGAGTLRDEEDLVEGVAVGTRLPEPPVQVGALIEGPDGENGFHQGAFQGQA